MFSRQSTLKDQLFCVTEERDYFQSKYLEQISEIQKLKDELTASKAEVSRLRSELMNTSGLLSPKKDQEEKKEDELDSGDDSSRTSQRDIRKNAAQLLQWADYRQRTPIKSPSQRTTSSQQDGSVIDEVKLDGTTRQMLQQLSVEHETASNLDDEDLTDEEDRDKDDHENSPMS